MDARPYMLCATLLCAACDEVFDLEHVEPAGPALAKTITITQQTQSTLTDFPLSILIENDGDLAAHADPAHIGFTDASGNPLPCELVGWDPETGALDAWVLLHELTPDPMAIGLVYGSSIAPCDPAELWNGARGVWHNLLQIDRTRDSSIHGHDVVADSASLPADAAGIVGRALRFDGTNRLCDDVDEDFSLAVGTSSFSYSLWVNLVGDIGAFDAPFSKGGSSQVNRGFDVELGTGLWRANISDGAHASSLTIELLPTGRYGGWVNLVTVIDRDARAGRAYVDGIRTDNTTLGTYASLTTMDPLCLGWGTNGVVDEVRVWNFALTDAWVAVEYANLMRRDQLMSIGPEKAR